MLTPGGSPQSAARQVGLSEGAAAAERISLVAEAVARAAGEADRAERLRSDTPLAVLGIDSLGLLCVADLLEESGWRLPDDALRTTSTVGDLADALAPAEGR